MPERLQLYMELLLLKSISSPFLTFQLENLHVIWLKRQRGGNIAYYNGRNSLYLLKVIDLTTFTRRFSRSCSCSDGELQVI
jgi:hypothetical protein